MNYDQLLAKFKDGAESGKAGVGYGGGGGWNVERSFEGARMYVRGNVIYSYGQHFPLAIRAEFGAGIKFVINGDKSTVTTNGHVRDAISKLKPNVQISFSALRGAGLAGDSRYTSDAYQIAEKVEIVAFTPDETYHVCAGCDQRVAEDGDYEHHADGSAICKGADGEGDYHYRHRLGAVLFKDRTDGQHYLSAFDENEKPGRNYFLCTIPQHPATVAEALELLKPLQVIEAEKAGRKVLRQGDIFLIEADKPEGKPTVKQSNLVLFDTRHIASTALTFGTNGTARTLITGKVTHTGKQHAPIFTRGALFEPVKNLADGSWDSVGDVD